MRPGVGHRLERGRHGRGQRAENEDPERHDQEGDHGEFDLARLDLLAEVFGRAPHHQPGEKDREHDVDKHPVEPGPHAAEDHLARLHVQEQHEPRKRHETVVHGVDRAVRGGGGRAAQSAESATPKRCSLPSMLPAAWSIPGPNSGLPACSKA